MKTKSLSRVRLFATPWTVTHQAPPSIEFSRQEYWSGLSFPTPRDLPDPGIKPKSPALQADALLSHQGSPMACSHAQSGFLRFFYYYLDCTTQLVGSQFPHQGLILCPRWWKHGVLITGPPENSLRSFIRAERTQLRNGYRRRIFLPCFPCSSVTAFQNYTVFSECALLSHCIISQMTFPSPPSVEFLSSFKTDQIAFFWNLIYLSP